MGKKEDVARCGKNLRMGGWRPVCLLMVLAQSGRQASADARLWGCDKAWCERGGLLMREWLGAAAGLRRGPPGAEGVSMSLGGSCAGGSVRRAEAQVDASAGAVRAWVWRGCARRRRRERTRAGFVWWFSEVGRLK